MADCACVDPLCDHGKGKRTRKAMSLPGSKGLCPYCFTHCRKTNKEALHAITSEVKSENKQS